MNRTGRVYHINKTLYPEEHYLNPSIPKSLNSSIFSLKKMYRFAKAIVKCLLHLF